MEPAKEMLELEKANLVGVYHLVTNTVDPDWFTSREAFERFKQSYMDKDWISCIEICKSDTREAAKLIDRVAYDIHNEFGRVFNSFMRKSGLGAGAHKLEEVTKLEELSSVFLYAFTSSYNAKSRERHLTKEELLNLASYSLLFYVMSNMGQVYMKTEIGKILAGEVEL